MSQVTPDPSQAEISGSDRVHRREQLLLGENEVLKLIIDRAPLTAVLESLARLAEMQSSAGMLASILLMDSDGLHLRHGAAPSLPAEYSKAIDGLTIGPAAGSCGTAAYLRRPVAVADIQTDPLWEPFRDLAGRHGLRACWSTPILSARRTVLGTFALYYRTPGSPDAEDEAMVEMLTRTAALAIEHNRSESALAESEERFRSLSRCAPVGVFMIDSTGAFNYVNPRFLDIAGFEYEKTFEYWLENATGDAPTVEVWRNAIQARTEFSSDFVISRNGTSRPVNLRMAPLRNRAGAYLGYVGTLEDVSARITGEAALQRESSLRQAIEQSIPAGIAVVSPDRTQTYVNRAFAAMVGWHAEELVGARAPFTYWPEDQLAEIENALSATLGGEAPANGYELQFVRKDGSRFHALCNIAAMQDDQGAITGWVAAVSDITARKQAEHDLARSEARLAMALEAGRMGAWEWDIRSGTVSWSPQLEVIHGILPGTFGGAFQDFQADMNPEHRPRVQGAIEQALHSKADYRVQYEIRRPNGESAWVEARGRVLCDSTGIPEKMVGVCMEIPAAEVAAGTGAA